MEILTKSAQETKKLGEEIADYIVRHGSLRGFFPKSASWQTQKGNPTFRSPNPRHPFGERSDLEKRKFALVLALYGELGSGKTTFVQGLAKGIGIPHRLVSPTFIIIREYPLNLKNFRRFYHIDLYRIEPEMETLNLGFGEIFSNRFNVVTIEWAERLGALLPWNRLDIMFTVKSDSERYINVKVGIYK